MNIMVSTYLFNMKKIIIFSSAIVFAALAVFFALRGCSTQSIHELPMVTVYRSQSGQVEQMDLEEYIIGTVAAEMPASFESEALKAQAICARTYALRKLTEGKSYPHQADLSDNINTCQGYLSYEEFAGRHPHQSEQWWLNIQQAVEETRGQVILHDNQLIDALYHSTCGGQTASALEVFGQNIDYLQSVQCGYCQISKRYKTEQVLDWQDVVAVSGEGECVEVMATSSTGRIEQVKVNQKVMKGSEFRQAFGLPSTRCTVRMENQGINVISYGYGHGVGLCQYGAQGMALQGKNYQQILAHYYPGTRIYKIPY
ncbi:MAG: stage II sporulation protein D [Syntrophomonadaceae bacterium]|jgi:stage II sporulation protein D